MWLAVPRPLFSASHSPLLYSRDGQLLGARIAADGQWRFAVSDSVSSKFVACLTAYEDKRFFYHPGIDPLAIARAVRQNLSAGERVSGGSTITMQLARIARGNRTRNFYEKSIEAMWALFLETTHSKREILALYAAHAPFGGNVIGVETAAWRYFGCSADALSWAEAATLAVLPNSPALIHPGRNRDQLLQKRNALLARLRDRGVIDDMTYGLACMESLPGAPVPLPDDAPHLLERLAMENPGAVNVSSLDAGLQRRATRIVNNYSRQHAANRVHNMAAIIACIETGEILAYVGNSEQEAGTQRAGSVDVITAPRSTGSVLKPILYAAMLHDGQILPNTLIADTPLNINGFVPQNYTREFYGAVPARAAIERSLNVALVRMLSMYNTGRLLTLLRRMGMTTLRFCEDHYGASLILGGAEGTLLDISGMYASMARILVNYGRDGLYGPRDIRQLTPSLAAKNDRRGVDEPPLLSAASIWHTFEAMSGLNRPEEESDWQQFGSMKQVAWKTGTSYGGRDAWAVGVTPRYVVGVWAGNASGEGRPGLTGVGVAAPVLFDLFSLLPPSGWFSRPDGEMEMLAVCRASGHRASSICINVDTLAILRSGIDTPICPYHRLVHLSPDGRWRVNSSCAAVGEMQSRSWFVLPPAQEYYYRHYNIEYRPLPPLRAGCREVHEQRHIELIYPEHGAVLFLPRGFDGEQRFVFRAAHVRPDATIFWYIDREYIGRTHGQHSISCSPNRGEYILTLTDEHGFSRAIAFEVK
ncbi:MAG: penicillin-binding protein 1C [Rikenellaceae bacterium]|nr:penicillin-binding protein 1C [Rikenellaceae bacterium]MCL2692531.1 penicillin-binding protein 1C [Rikenellaceae bacterium]